MAKFTGHTITDDSALGGMIIEKSVRLNQADNAYLSRTTTVAGDRRTFTLSGWFKFYKNNVSDVGQDFIFMCGTDPNNQLQLSREGIAQINFEPKTSSSTDARFYTSSKFRDNSWYHFVLKIDSTQGTASDRMAFYINGVQDNEDSAVVGTTYPSQNLEFKWGENSSSHVIGRRTHSGYEGNSNFQVADVHYVSGYAYEPTAFGYFDSQTGIWRPKKYTGSYGSAGWHLEFKDSSAIGKDTSGNGNDFTANNVSAHDVLIDTPTNQFATWNANDGEGKDNSGSWSEGNLKVQIAYQGNAEESGATLAFSSGKWYWEEYMQSSTDNAGNVGVGVKSVEGRDFNFWRVRGNGGESDHNGTQTNIGTTWTTGDIVGIAVDMDAGTWTVSKNGTFIGANIHTNLSGTVTPVMHNSNGGERHTFITNFGQDSSFAGTKTAQGYKDTNGLGDFYYEVPSGYQALCTANLVPNTSSIIRPQKHFDVLLYTPTSSNLTVDGLEFTPDLIWAKSRTQAYSPYFFDVVRGTGQKALNSATNAQEGADTTALTSFDRGGFTVPVSGINDSGSGTNGVVAWCWKAGGAAVSNSDGSITTSISANQEAGFSIVTWTGTGSNSTVGHGLGKAPKWIICKLRDTTTQDWFFNVGEITGDRGKYMKFNESGGIVSDIHTFPPTAATSTVFTVGGEDGGNSSNGNGSKYVAYCWAEIPGYSKIGQYKGNGSADGTFVHLGFRPAWIIVKKSTDDNWPIYDYKRDPHNVGDHRLFGDVNTVEGAVGQEHIDFLSNGIKWRRDKNPFNDNGSTYFYMAFARQPGLTPYDTFANAR